MTKAKIEHVDESGDDPPTAAPRFRRYADGIVTDGRLFLSVEAADDAGIEYVDAEGPAPCL